MRVFIGNAGRRGLYTSVRRAGGLGEPSTADIIVRARRRRRSASGAPSALGRVPPSSASHSRGGRNLSTAAVTDGRRRGTRTPPSSRPPAARAEPAPCVIGCFTYGASKTARGAPFASLISAASRFSNCFLPLPRCTYRFWLRFVVFYSLSVCVFGFAFDEFFSFFVRNRVREGLKKGKRLAFGAKRCMRVALPPPVCALAVYALGLNARSHSAAR